MAYRNPVKVVIDYFSLPKNANRDPETGKELLDPVPIAPPIGWHKQPSMFDQVRDMVRSEHLKMYALAQGAETFEEASDFDVADDIYPASQYEDANDFEPVADLQARRQAEFRREYLAERERRREARERREWKAEDESRQNGPQGQRQASQATSAEGQGSQTAEGGA